MTWNNVSKCPGKHFEKIALSICNKNLEDSQCTWTFQVLSLITFLRGVDPLMSYRIILLSDAVAPRIFVSTGLNFKLCTLSTPQVKDLQERRNISFIHHVFLSRNMSAFLTSLGDSRNLHLEWCIKWSLPLKSTKCKVFRRWRSVGISRDETKWYWGSPKKTDGRHSQ